MEDERTTTHGAYILMTFHIVILIIVSLTFFFSQKYLLGGKNWPLIPIAVAIVLYSSSALTLVYFN